MNEGIFDGDNAAQYDQRSADRFRPEVLDPAVDLLEELADGGPALELAIGTGRVGLPLSQRGVPVSGIELSADMVAQLRTKPGGEQLPVTIGDMTSTRIDGTFSLAYLVYNTIVNPGTQEGQVACFTNAAAHLAPGGRFVIETNISPIRRLPMGERFVPFHVSPGHIGIDELDVATQQGISHHTWIEGEQAHVVDFHYRYTWPSELDLMARIAGMELEHRWENWHRDPFTNESETHISVWRKL